MKWYDWYWIVWIFITLGLFLPVELQAVFSGHPERTFSAFIWRVEDFIPGNDAPWTTTHWIIGIFLLLLFLWLAFHFPFGFLR